jgi:diguanylate cyclase (GGDEF)-like protein
MTPNATEVLLIEDNSTYAGLIHEMLAEASLTGSRFPAFRLTRADRLETGLKRLAEGQFDVILLDLTLPDSDEMNTFARVTEQAHDTPVVILTGLSDEGLAMQALQAGAQDYLIKGEIHQHPLPHALCYAIERHRLLRELKAQSLHDPLTGLYNRRGFFALAEQQLRLATRNRQDLLLIFADLDDLKAINDRGGHAAGDQALQEVAQALRATFRESDIVGRLAGDEFAVLAIGAGGHTAKFLAARLFQNLQMRNAQRDSQFPLTLSLGAARYDSAQPVSIDGLLAQADQAMYQAKRMGRPTDLAGLGLATD